MNFVERELLPENEYIFKWKKPCGALPRGNVLEVLL